jgi:hypothetical protein
MAFETEDSSRISWFMGTISSVQVADPLRWPDSPWRLLQVIMITQRLVFVFFFHFIVVVCKKKKKKKMNFLMSVITTNFVSQYQIYVQD